jgi:type IV pilus assembly protein PilE
MPISRERPDPRSAAGFTLIELLITLVVLSLLVVIAVPAYASPRTRAYDTVAKDTLSRAVLAAHVYFVDNDTFVGMNVSRLRAVDPGLPRSGIAFRYRRATSYCLRYTYEGRRWYKAFPVGDYTQTRCR